MPDLLSYLAAFYHTLPVRILPGTLSWTSWPNSSRTRHANLPKHIGLAHANTTTRIRVRPTSNTTFPAQLNLNDIIDALIPLLPRDAYALCLIIDVDIYDSAADEFCCGRAYGGSRVAVVQRARYDPALDDGVGIDGAHVWPMSHCAAFVDQVCAVEDVFPTAATEEERRAERKGEMRGAVDAALHTDLHGEGDDDEAVWFSRVAKTVAHELGHCFGMEHCTYYACEMQGTAGLKEDARQPPYLCPVCEAKVGYAVVGEGRKGGEMEREVWVKERCEALRAFCIRMEEEGRSCGMWRGLDAWLEERIRGL